MKKSDKAFLEAVKAPETMNPMMQAFSNNSKKMFEAGVNWSANMLVKRFGLNEEEVNRVLLEESES